jgi:DNA polymerase-4
MHSRWWRNETQNVMDETTRPRKILHLDLDAFFCAVEELRDPSLRGKPFAVGGAPDKRGVVASCSYAARQYGVHSAMPMARALQRCPDLIIVRGRHSNYGEHSERVMSHLYNLTDRVEQLSIDEAFLDVSDLKASGEILARRLQQEIWEQNHLPCSIGVASNKLLAKAANDVGKSRAKGDRPPMAITVVPPGEEAAFLAPLPVDQLWGVGPKTKEQLAALGIRTIGDLAAWPRQDLIRRLGEHGRALARRARGIDDRPVVTEHETKSMSRETTFAEDVSDRDLLCRTLLRLTRSVGRRLRRAELQGSTIKLKLRWSDFTTITRQTTLDRSTDQDAEIYEAAQTLFEAAWPRGRPVRLIGVGVSNLEEPREQLTLWETSSKRGKRLQETLDELRERFGRDAVKRASEIERGQEEQAT